MRLSVVAASLLFACARPPAQATEGPEPPPVAPARSEQETPPPERDFALITGAWAPGGAIPAVYTCEGEDSSPPLIWQGVPPGTQSLALIVEDPDAPDPSDPKTIWTHWVLYNLPATADAGLVRAVEQLSEGTLEGRNDWGRTGYGGPCPPVGEHRYFHRLYALDVVLPDLGEPDRAALLEAMRGHVLGQADLVGTYVKAGKE